MLRRDAAWWSGVVVVAWVAGCGEGGAGGSDESGRGGAAGGRRFADVRIDTLWTRGGVTDTVIELPIYLRAAGDLVLLADGARRGVVAMSANDGATAWAIGRSGRGPGEFERPAVIEALRDGRLAVVDTEVGRISFLSRAGEFLGETPLTEAQLSGLCAFTDGTMLGVAATSGENFTLLAADGALIRTYPVPWEELREESLLSRQFVTAPAPDGHACFFALSFGRGFGAFEAGRFAFTKDFVEPLDPPQVRVRESGTRSQRQRSEGLGDATLAARALAASEDRLFVLFEGATRDAGRIVDVYTRTGEYDYSFILPRSAQRLDWSNDTFYLLTQIEGVPVVTAARIRRSS